MSFERKVTEEANSNIIQKIVFLFVPYWPLFAVIIILSISCAWLYISYTTPLYQSYARVLIKDEKKGLEEAKTLELLDGLSSKKIIENEVEVIQSRTLLVEVVKHLHLYAPVFEQKKFKKFISAYTTSPIRIEAKNVDSIKEAKLIPIAYDPLTAKVTVGGSAYPLNEFVSTPFGALKFTRNSYFGTEPNTGKPFFFSLESPKAVANGIGGRLRVVVTNKQSSILDVVFIDEVPQRGEDVINDLLSTYTAATLRDKNILATNTLNFIDDRLKYVEHDLDSIERKIEQYRSRRGAIDISTQGKLFLQNVSSNDLKLSDINMQLAALSQVENYVISKDKSSGVVPASLGVSDPTLTSLVEKLYNTELSYESLRKTTGDNNPLLVSIEDQIQKIKPSILENIQNQRRSLLATKNNLSSTNGLYSSMLQTIPEKERQLIDINREQGIKNEIYNFLLQKREETALSRASTVSDHTIIDRAQSSGGPVSPKRKVIYLLSLLLALGAGVGIVLGKETFNRKVMFTHEIENLTKHPVIGEIAIEYSKNPIVVGEGKRTFIAEQFRKLRASLSYIGVDAIHNKILVTSSISNEGKSFIATNLALSLAITGKKVVLVDFDLNNPSLNNKLNITKQIGLTEFLEGKCNVEQIIKATDLHRNLFLVPTGKLPDSPTELIMSGGVEAFFSYLDENFDYVVVDTAPVVPVTDAYLLSSYCDATLYVVRHGYTPKNLIERIDVSNKINKLNNMAIVFNGITPRGYKKNYGYGYGYGYVYGYVGDKKAQKLLAASRK